MLLGFLTFLGFLIFSKFASRVYNKPIGTILFIIAFSFLFTPVIESVKSFSVGKRKIKNLVYLSLFNQILFIFLVSLLFFFKLSTTFYISLAYIFVSFIVFIYAISLVLNESYETDGKFSKSDVRSYIKVGFVFGFFKNLFFQSTLMVGARYVNLYNIAYFNFSISITIASIFAVISAMHTIIIPYMATIYNEGQTDKAARYLSATTKLGLFVSIIVGFLVYIFLWLFIGKLFPKYIGALQILPYIFLAFILLNFNTPMSFLKAKGKLLSLTKASIIATVFSFINSYLLSKYFGLKGMILSLILNILFMCLLIWYYAYKDLKLKFTIIPSKEEIAVFKIYMSYFLSKFISKFRWIFK